MKKQSSADSFSILLPALIAIILLLSGCASSRSDSSNEVVATAIELADAYMARADIQSALDVYDRAISNTNDYRLHYNRAYCFACAGDYLKAAQLCLESHDQFPDKSEFLVAASTYYNLAELPEKSLECLETILSLSEDDVSTRLDAMKMALSLGMTQKAYEHALVLWQMQVFQKDVASVLYSNDPERWQAVYDFI